MTNDDETVTVTVELTEQQYNDALSAINSEEVRLTDDGKRERSIGLTHVWAQIYRGGKDTFRGDA
jgi:hypothetical protein